MFYQQSPYVSSENPFWIQYTSLILIVLTFIVAVFFAPDAFRKAPKLPPKADSPVGEIEFANLFNVEGGELNKEALAGVIFALSNHDLDSTIFVYGASAEEALARSVTLFKELVRQGVPAQAVRSYAQVLKDTKDQVKVQFYETALQ